MGASYQNSPPSHGKALLNPALGGTDRCVMCGMCLPHCPTYLKTRNEADSPRGRIALMRALNEGRLEPDASLRVHLDRCLGCRACESVCPSAVPYGRLIDGAREVLRDPSPGPEPRPWWGRFVEKRGLRRLGAGVLRAARITGLETLAGVLAAPRTKRALGLLRASQPGFFQGGSLPISEGPRVALFTGCAAEVFDVATLQAAQRLLTHLGCRVDIPPAQGCCGALYQHDGLPGRAREQAKSNITAFDIAGCEAILTTASGCGAQLAEYAGMYPELFETRNPQAFGDKVRDISRYLHESGLLDTVDLAPLAGRVAVHTPCSLHHVMKAATYPLALLQRIPDIELLPLPDASCCGAAGKYLLSQADMADALVQDKLDTLRQMRPDILVTSNIGCALHLRAGMRREGLDIEVLHPVTLLERQLR